VTGLQRLCAGDDSADGSAAVRGRRNPTYASSATAMETMLVQNSARCDGVNAIANFTRIGDCFDFAFDAVGKVSFFRCRGLLKPKGTFIAVRR